MKRSPTVAEVVLLVSAVVVVLGSLLGFAAVNRSSTGTWGDLSPLSLYPVAAAVLAIVLVVITVSRGQRPGRKVLTLDTLQWTFVSSLIAVLVMGGIAMAEATDLRFGGTLMLLGAAGMIVGATLDLYGKATAPVNLPGLPTPPGATPAGGAPPAPAAPGAPGAPGASTGPVPPAPPATPPVVPPPLAAPPPPPVVRPADPPPPPPA